MPRFGLKSLLFLFAILGVWLATFSVEDPTLTGASSHIRKSMLLVILVAAGVAALFSRGRRRTFWTAFFAMMLLLLTNILGNYYQPDSLNIAANVASPIQHSLDLSNKLHAMFFWAAWHGTILGFAAVTGLVAAWVYDQNSHNR